ncbi:MAG: hypothetical protein VB101_06295 [Rhodospirillaceae bacterium]|nr:hypothetical protein [Rhodospirillaceae bacterium]
MDSIRLILVAVIAALLAALGGFFYGRHVEALDWELAVQRQKTEAAAVLAEAERRVADEQARRAALSLDIEVNHAKRQAAIDAAYAENRRLSDRIVGLLDAGTGPGGGGALSGNPGAATGNPGLCPAYRELSGAMAGLLGAGAELARNADREAAAATACREWAVGMGGGP